MNWSKEHSFWRIVFFYKSLISFLNAAKTELLWCMPPRQRDRLPNAALRVGSDSVQPVRCVRDLGIYIISDVSMRTHIMRTVSNCFSAPYSFKALGCQSVSLCCCHWLGHWYWRDSTTTAQPYGSGVPGHLLNRLQSVLNAAERLVSHARKYDHVTHLRCDLHWLRVSERIYTVSGKKVPIYFCL